VLYFVAVCVAASCKELQYVAVCGNARQYIIARRVALQHVALFCSVCCSVLQQNVAVCLHVRVFVCMCVCVLLVAACVFKLVALCFCFYVSQGNRIVYIPIYIYIYTHIH